VPERISAGVLLYRRAGNRLEVLLAHPGGPFQARRDLGNWSIPKGEPDPGEDPETAGRREFAEETGSAVPGTLVPLGSIRQKGGKLVLAWAGEGDLDPGQATSNTFELEWPPGSGRLERFPEIDRVEWFGLGEARIRIKDAQVELLDRLAAHLGADPPGAAPDAD